MISVCAPFWNRQEALDGMVQMYADLYPDMDIEISICDDGSEPPAAAPDGVTLTRLPHKTEPLNPCVPMNRAVEASSGDVVVITNPETRHDGPVLHEMLGLLETDDDYVTARCYGVGYAQPKLPLAGPEIDYSTRGRLPVPDGAHYHFLAMCHRSLWDRAGGFDPDYRHYRGADDVDWLWRLDRAGARFRVTTGQVWQPKGESRWSQLPHGRTLFREKWGKV